jgi:hypothetical protein
MIGNMTELISKTQTLSIGIYHNGSKHELYKYSRELDCVLALIPRYFPTRTVTTSSGVLTVSSFRVKKKISEDKIFLRNGGNNS